MSDSFDNLIQNPTGPEAEAAGGGAAPEKKRGLKRALLTIAAVLCVLALLVCGAAVWGYTVSVSDKNLPNVYVDGVFVGGMTREETAAALTAAGFDAMEDAQLSVSLPAGAGFTVDFLRSGAVLGREQAVSAACAYGHDRDVFQNLWRSLLNRLRPVDVLESDRKLDDAYIRACCEEGAAALDRNLQKAAWVADVEGGKLVLFKGAGGVDLDLDALAGEVKAALESGQTALSFSALKSEPAMPDFEELYRELAVEPVDAYFTETFEVVPEVVGCAFGVEQAVELWKAAAVGEQVVVPLTLTPPETTAADLQALLFRDVLGAQATSYAWSTPERIGNIELAASKIDGLILLPGESFSYNETVGQRTTEAGFRTAQAYSDGTVVEAIGGGICQVSSTLYAATMYARLKTLVRQNHYFKVGYIDYGLDATVSWGQPDFKFRNDRDYPIKIAAYTLPDDQALVVEIWGTDTDGVTVRLRHTADEVYDEEYTDVLIGYSIHTYGDLYDADGNYIDTMHENSGVYYFHDEDIEWPEGHESATDPFLDGYINPT